MCGRSIWRARTCGDGSRSGAWAALSTPSRTTRRSAASPSAKAATISAISACACGASLPYPLRLASAGPHPADPRRFFFSPLSTDAPLFNAPSRKPSSLPSRDRSTYPSPSAGVASRKTWPTIIRGRSVSMPMAWRCRSPMSAAAIWPMPRQGRGPMPPMMSWPSIPSWDGSASRPTSRRRGP